MSLQPDEETHRVREHWDRFLREGAGGIPAPIVGGSIVVAVVIMLLVSATIMSAIGRERREADRLIKQEAARLRREEADRRWNDPDEVAKREAQAAAARAHKEALAEERKKQADAEREKRESFERSMQNLIDQGYIKSMEKPKFGTVVAQVTPRFMGLDYDEKRTTISFIYIYNFGEKDMSNRVELIHCETGRLIGVMSMFDGIKFY